MKRLLLALSGGKKETPVSDTTASPEHQSERRPRPDGDRRVQQPRGTGTVYNEPWAGHVAEQLVYKRALTDAERTSIEDYLGKKYGLALNRAATTATATQ